MELEKREPLDFSANQAGHAPTVEAELTLDMPVASGPLAPAAQEGPPAPTGDGTRVRLPTGALAAPTPAYGRFLYAAAMLASLLWAAFSVYALNYQLPIGGVDLQAYQMGVFAVFAIAPIGFIWIAVYCVRQGARLAAEVSRTKALAADMLEPAAIAAAETGALVEDVRLEIDAAVTSAARARAELLSLRKALAEESEGLAASAEASAEAARLLRKHLSEEREAVEGLASNLDARSEAITEAIGRQATMVAEASDLAQTQIGEAEAALAARAADLVTAASDAGEASRVASEDLARQVARLETATLGVSDQIVSMEDTLTQQRAALVQVAHAVRSDHEDFSLKIETQQAQLADILFRTQTGVADLSEAAATATESLGELTTTATDQVRTLAETATEQVRALAETAQSERDLLAANALQSLGALSEAAKFERETLQQDLDATLRAMGDSAEHERNQVEEHVRSRLADLADAARVEREALQVEALNSLQTVTEAAQTASQMAESYSEKARRKFDELNETAFDVSQKAEAVFQTRLKEATDLIASSAQLIDQAAAKTAERIEAASRRARETLSELETAVTEFETRAAELPGEARAQAERLKATLSEGFDGLLASARAAAEETQAIDAAFQDRVRRNYEMLSEAVRLMGVVSSRSGGAPSAVLTRNGPPASAPTAPRPEPPRAEAPRPEPKVDPAAKETSLEDPSADRDAQARPARRFPFAPKPPGAVPTGLRPRLKLAPTAADSEISQVFDAAAEAPSSETGDWTWQNILSSMDDAPVEDAQLADRLIGEIEALGVDLDALLPASRIAEIAAVIEAGDSAGARTVVRHLAPTAVRRLSRRALAERPLRAHAERFIRRYETSLDEAGAGKGGGPEIVRLLGTEEGRTYLLFDAALGEPG